MSVKLSDFGSAMEVKERLRPEKAAESLQPRFYRAPEVILGLAYDTQIDVPWQGKVGESKRFRSLGAEFSFVWGVGGSWGVQQTTIGRCWRLDDFVERQLELTPRSVTDPVFQGVERGLYHLRDGCRPFPFCWSWQQWNAPRDDEAPWRETLGDSPVVNSVKGLTSSYIHDLTRSYCVREVWACAVFCWQRDGMFLIPRCGGSCMLTVPAMREEAVWPSIVHATSGSLAPFRGNSAGAASCRIVISGERTEWTLWSNVLKTFGSFDWIRDNKNSNLGHL